MEEKALLALDVGTRKITGLLMKPSADGYRVHAVETIEHKTRAMLDGQIQDIPKVAEVIRAVRAVLEKKNGAPLKEAAVAAAGRSLCTVKADARMECRPAGRLSREDILGLEYAAAFLAQQKLLAGPHAKSAFAEQFHCVGYSVTRYTLDGSPIGNLVGQRGMLAACEVIATFLPRVVVDSLRSVLELAGLKLQSLTLEPIAALGMVVPPEMRRLNLALVDIGAGTSDIAITRDGSVFAYDMVPVAGDEITEALCNEYLLDFLKGEDVKRKLHQGGAIAAENVLGEKITVTGADASKALAQILHELAGRIAGAVLKHNSTAPQAVFCVGGGSLMPGLPQAIAGELGLETGRVAVKGKEMVRLLPGKARRYHGPELVTPLGIAYTALRGEALRFIHVQVNGHGTNVLDLGRGTVADALLAAGINSRDLVGAPGRGLTLEINGQILTFPGEMGEMAKILVNGQPATLEAKISNEDEIEFTAGSSGADACFTAGSLLKKMPPFKIVFNGKERTLAPPMFRGENRLSDGDALYDRDKLRVLRTTTLSQALFELGLSAELTGGEITVTVNGVLQQFPYGPKVIRINGKPAVAQSEVSDGDILETAFDGGYPTVGSVTDVKEKQINFSVNDKTYILPLREVRFVVNGLESEPESKLGGGDIVEILTEEREVNMADVLNLINFRASPPAGKNRLVLRVNGREAQFTTTILEGDRLEVGWSA